MGLHLIAFFLILLITATLCLSDCGHDFCRSGADLILSKGYPFESHFVETDDCYTLQLFRIPHGTTNQIPPLNNETLLSQYRSILASLRLFHSTAHSMKRPVVFLQHGILDSADSFLINSANQSLGYLLADAGFDVWLGNTRGNKYSRNSTCYDADSWLDKRFWHWSFDEMAEFDLPAMIDYVLQRTQQNQLTLIAHSQGCTQVLVNFLSSLSVTHRINTFIALAPVWYLKHAKSVLIKALADWHVDTLISMLKFNEILPDSKFWKALAPRACKHASRLCEFSIFLLCGYDVTGIDVNRLPIYMSHFPSGVSMREMIHYAQMIRQSRVAAFDFGYFENQRVYGSHQPPIYNISQVVAPPTYIFFGEQDQLANSIDVRRLIEEYPTYTLKAVYSYSTYGHVDFIWGMHVKQQVYDKVIEIAHNAAVAAMQPHTIQPVQARPSE